MFISKNARIFLQISKSISSPLVSCQGFCNAIEVTKKSNTNSIELNPSRTEVEVSKNLEVINIENNDILKRNRQLRLQYEPPSPLAPIDPKDNTTEYHDITNFVPTFNFASYVNSSETLKQLVHLGVDLSKIEKRKGLVEFILKLDTDKLKSFLLFLTDNGIEANELGQFITKNPLIFKEDLDNLQIRINYLESKKFTVPQIHRIIQKNPYWLMFSIERIDRRLGYFQTNFKLNGNEIRQLTIKQPRLITYHLYHVRQNVFTIKEEMGFNNDEMKTLILSKPRLLMKNADAIMKTFYYLHKVMKLSHEQILKSPEILTSREFRIRQRHEFLKFLNKAVYDPKNDLYVSLDKLIKDTDLNFVVNVAKSNMEIYNNFLRTL